MKYSYETPRAGDSIRLVPEDEKVTRLIAVLERIAIALEDKSVDRCFVHTASVSARLDFETVGSSSYDDYLITYSGRDRV